MERALETLVGMLTAPAGAATASTATVVASTARIVFSVLASGAIDPARPGIAGRHDEHLLPLQLARCPRFPRRRPEHVDVETEDRAARVCRPEPATCWGVAVGAEHRTAVRDQARVDGDVVPVGERARRS